MNITIDEVKANHKVRTYIERADESLIALGYTEHSYAHVTHVAQKAREILETLGYPQRDCELQTKRLNCIFGCQTRFCPRALPLWKRGDSSINRILFGKRYAKTACQTAGELDFIFAMLPKSSCLA